MSGLILAAVWWAFAQWRRQAVTLDDAFISYRYAYNLVHGRGIVFNAGERVEGYTNFLWMLIAAAAMRVGRDAFYWTRGIGVAAYLVCVGLGFGIAVWPQDRRPWLRRIPLIALAALLVVPPSLAAFAGTGLETSFVGLTVLAIGIVHHLAPPRRPVARFLAQVLPLLALLTRLDTVLPILASALTFAWCCRHGFPGEDKTRTRASFGLFVPAAVGLAVYLVWKRLYYGDLMPNSYYAKAADEFHPDAGFAYVMGFVQSCPASIVVVLFAAFGLAIARPGPRSAFLLYGVLATAFHVAYAVKVGGDFMEYRFMWELWPLAVCVAIVGAGEVASRHLSVAIAGAAVALAIASPPIVLEKKYGMQSIPQMNDYAEVGARVGTGLGRALPPGTIVATTLAGMAYFMPDVVTIDQWGLNDRFVAHRHLRRYLEVEGVDARGHLKLAPESYLRARNVSLLIDHPTICDCNGLCRDDKPDIYVRLDNGNDCLRTRYLTENQELTRWFCSHPHQFVLDHVACPAEP